MVCVYKQIIRMRHYLFVTYMFLTFLFRPDGQWAYLKTKVDDKDRYCNRLLIENAGPSLEH